MGPFLSNGFRAGHIVLIGFFVRPGVPFLPPRPAVLQTDARRSCQGWPTPQPCGVLRPCQATVVPSSVAVSREHRRAKTDRLDTELLKRAFLGWLRGERDHCKMVAIPTLTQEDAKRPNRERESLVGEQSRIVNRMKAL